MSRRLAAWYYADARTPQGGLLSSYADTNKREVWREAKRRANEESHRPLTITLRAEDERGGVIERVRLVSDYNAAPRYEPVSET